MNAIIIVAGGKGLRMGTDVPKQFLLLGGKPVLMRTLEAFHRFDADAPLIVVLPKEQQAYWRTLCVTYDFGVPHTIADGGDTRFASVKNGLNAIPPEIDGWVAVHDGVRPLVSVRLIRACFEAAREHRAVVPAIPVVESLRFADGKSPSRTIDRNGYYAVQTPQVFALSLLRKAYRQPCAASFTDDASVVEAAGTPISIVAGEPANIKLTTPFDLKLAEVILQSQ